MINIQASSTRDEEPIHFTSVNGTLEGAEGLLSGLEFLSSIPDLKIGGEIPILVPEPRLEFPHLSLDRV